MIQEDIAEIKSLIDEVANSSTKKDSQEPLNKLEFKAAHLKGEINGYAKTKLSQAINKAKEASGQILNKETKLYDVENSWATFIKALK